MNRRAVPSAIAAVGHALADRAAAAAMPTMRSALRCAATPAPTRRPRPAGRAGCRPPRRGANTETATVAATSGIAPGQSGRRCRTPWNARPWRAARSPSGRRARKAMTSASAASRAAEAAASFDDAAGERRRVPPMAGEVEGHRDIAVARQRGGELLHELLRPGEAVRDDHHRRAASRGRPEHGDRDWPHLGRGDARPAVAPWRCQTPPPMAASAATATMSRAIVRKGRVLAVTGIGLRTVAAQTDGGSRLRCDDRMAGSLSGRVVSSRLIGQLCALGRL